MTCSVIGRCITLIGLLLAMGKASAQTDPTLARVQQDHTILIGYREQEEPFSYVVEGDPRILHRYLPSSGRQHQRAVGWALREALQASLSSPQTQASLAAGLGIHPNTLSRWRMSGSWKITHVAKRFPVQVLKKVFRILLAGLIASDASPERFHISSEAPSDPEPYGLMLRRDDLEFLA